jgi:hypothetical protein
MDPYAITTHVVRYVIAKQIAVREGRKYHQLPPLKPPSLEFNAAPERQSFGAGYRLPKYRVMRWYV